ncbi:MAG TPA: two-component system response regulator [Rhodospirillaceae bacterium]|jgi:two-component system chemotaxis response regulator CheY|nr:response regulator [Alphaproteobacteria bacterium]HBH25945.1 two-component system response regulator [Rhodospirillaceae bacterium]
MSIDPALSILIVDDYKTMLRVIRNLLSQIGLKDVDEATDGAKAADMLRMKKYGLIISDWNMEPVSGLDLLKVVRAGRAGDPNVPFIMVTAENKVENILAAKQAGVSNYIVKPFSAETLRTKIEAVLKSAGDKT